MDRLAGLQVTERQQISSKTQNLRDQLLCDFILEKNV